MLVEQELIKKVRDYFDLNIYETKVWLALLRKGVASAGEISSMSGVPRSRTYDVLEGLEKRGFVILKLEKPVKYIGVKPRIILEKLKNNVRKNAEDKMMEISQIKETSEFENLEKLYTEGLEPIKNEDTSLALRGRTNITNHLKDIISNTKEEVIMCINVEELLSKAKLFQQTFTLLKKSNVKIKIVLSGNDSVIKQAEKKFEMKFKRTNISAKFFIVDRKEILFYLSKNVDEESAIWLNSEFFSQAFASLFEKATKL
ncbi:TrmB family transcriptional regulator [Candidatus Pacearchaeota archaeon]|nr:TrmB family transcriptional regulator [Candidatus Pacearchaeota archaeon]